MQGGLSWCLLPFSGSSSICPSQFLVGGFLAWPLLVWKMYHSTLSPGMADHFFLLQEILCRPFSPPSTTPASAVFQSWQDDVMKAVLLSFSFPSQNFVCPRLDETRIGWVFRDLQGMVLQWSLVGFLPQWPWCNSPLLFPFRGPAILPLCSPEVTCFLLLLFLLWRTVCLHLQRKIEMNSCQSSVRSLIPFSEDFLSAHLKY